VPAGPRVGISLRVASRNSRADDLAARLSAALHSSQTRTELLPLAMILSAGLSPAWQQILTFDAVRVGHVNRATSAWWCASGKVLNVARAVQSLEGEGHTLCTIGGLSGMAIREEFAADGLTATWIETQTSTRVC